MKGLVRLNQLMYYKLNLDNLNEQISEDNELTCFNNSAVLH